MSIETTPNSREGIETWKARELARSLLPRDRPSIYRHRTRRPSVSGTRSSTHGRRKCSVRARCSDSMAHTPAGSDSHRDVRQRSGATCCASGGEASYVFEHDGRGYGERARGLPQCFAVQPRPRPKTSPVCVKTLDFGPDAPSFRAAKVLSFFYSRKCTSCDQQPLLKIWKKQNGTCLNVLIRESHWPQISPRVAAY